MTSSRLLVVRPAVREDVPFMLGAVNAMAIESEGMHLNMATLEAGIMRVFDEPTLGTYWLVCDETAPVAMCMVTPEWSDWHNRPYWWIQSVYIQPNYRGQGVMGQLVDTITEAAKTAGVQELRLYVDHANERAIRAYEKLDFSTGHYQMMVKNFVQNGN